MNKPILIILLIGAVLLSGCTTTYNVECYEADNPDYVYTTQIKYNPNVVVVDEVAKDICQQEFNDLVIKVTRED